VFLYSFKIGLFHCGINFLILWVYFNILTAWPVSSFSNAPFATANNSGQDAIVFVGYSICSTHWFIDICASTQWTFYKKRKDFLSVHSLLCFYCISNFTQLDTLFNSVSFPLGLAKLINTIILTASNVASFAVLSTESTK